MNIIIGNIIALTASVIMVYTGYIKKKEKIIYMQTVHIGLSVLSNIVLGGITGAITNTINCVRNILFYKGKLNKLSKTILIILAVIFSLYFNNLGFVGLLPLISAIVYILLMDIKDVIKFKYLIIFTLILWFCYDLYVKSYTAACFDLMCIIANIISIIQLNKKFNIIKQAR